MMLDLIRNIFRKPAPAPMPNSRPDPCSLESIRDFLMWSGADSIHFVRQGNDVCHLVVTDGNITTNSTFRADETEASKG